MDKDLEELIERAAAEMPPEAAAEAIDALAEGLQVPREEMAKIVAEELGVDEYAPERGASYMTGFSIAGQHCGGCGRPDSTRDDWSHGMRVLNTTPCCGRLACNGRVTTTPWVGNETGREVWACCIGEAERRLGEQVKLCLDPGRSVVR